MIRLPFSFSSTRSSSFARSSIAWALCLCLASSTLLASGRPAAFDSSTSNIVEELSLKLASGDPVRAVDYQQAIYNLLSEFVSWYGNDGVWYTLPMDVSTGVPLSDFLGRGMFYGYSTGADPSSGDSYLRAISRALNGTPQGSYQNASGGILPLVQTIATNGWRSSDIAAQSAQLAAILGAVQYSTNVWQAVDVSTLLGHTSDLVDLTGSAASSAESASYSLMYIEGELSQLLTDLGSTISDNAQSVSLVGDPFEVVVEAIEESTTEYINSLNSLVRDFVIGGVDYTASNTAAIVDYVENINSILNENFDVQLSASLDVVSNVVDLLRLIHEDDLGYNTTSRSVQADFLSLLQSLGYGPSTGSSTTLASDMGIVQHDLLRAADAAASNLLANSAQSLGLLEAEAVGSYTGDDSYSMTNAPLPVYEDLIEDADTAAASTAMSAGAQSFEQTAQQLQGMIGTGGDDEIVVIPEMTVGPIHVREYRARLGTSITPICRRIMQFVWAVSLFAALFGLASSEWAFYANLGRNWTMSGGFHEKGSP